MSRTTATQIHNKRTTCPAAQRSTSVRAVRSCTRARAHGPRMRTSVHASVAQEAAMRDAQAHTAPTPSNGKPVITKHVLLSASASTRSHCSSEATQLQEDTKRATLCDAPSASGSPPPAKPSHPLAATAKAVEPREPRCCHPISVSLMWCFLASL
ncbi:hypothetical protein BC826DRAFT_1033751 [Russula brevipes]|nr:hypothetical protein BC826DRAFT_1033751 [Russula brevipes]